MVPASRTEGATGTHLLSVKVRKTIQSIKEIVGDHSEADIYVALKETNMDPNETTQKLLNQGWFFCGVTVFFFVFFIEPYFFGGINCGF
jgi:hypothetical protein